FGFVALDNEARDQSEETGGFVGCHCRYYGAENSRIPKAKRYRLSVAIVERHKGPPMPQGIFKFDGRCEKETPAMIPSVFNQDVQETRSSGDKNQKWRGGILVVHACVSFTRRIQERRDARVTDSIEYGVHRLAFAIEGVQQDGMRARKTRPTRRIIAHGD